MSALDRVHYLVYVCSPFELLLLREVYPQPAGETGQVSNVSCHAGLKKIKPGNK